MDLPKTGELLESVCRTLHNVLTNHFELWPKSALKNVRFTDEKYISPTAGPSAKATEASAVRTRPCPKSKKHLYMTATSPGPSRQTNESHASTVLSTEYPTPFQQQVKNMTYEQFKERTNIMHLLKHPPNGIHEPVRNEKMLQAFSNKYYQLAQDERQYKRWTKYKWTLKYLRPIDAPDAFPISATPSNRSRTVSLA